MSCGGTRSTSTRRNAIQQKAHKRKQPQALMSWHLLRKRKEEKNAWLNEGYISLVRWLELRVMGAGNCERGLNDLASGHVPSNLR